MMVDQQTAHPRLPSSSEPVLSLKSSRKNTEQEASHRSIDSSTQQTTRIILLKEYGTRNPTDPNQSQHCEACSILPPSSPITPSNSGKGAMGEKKPIERWEAEDAGSQPWNAIVGLLTGSSEQKVGVNGSPHAGEQEGRTFMSSISLLDNSSMECLAASSDRASNEEDLENDDYDEREEDGRDFFGLL
jgi:hypothetical protein